jgi:D-cysteine desulfhydrase
MAFEFPDRVTLAHTPTPIERLVRLEKVFEGPELWVKRDDLTGTGKTGNKVRKLEFLCAAAQREKCDVLITCGGLQSNHARATAVAAAKLGMKSHLVLRDSTGGDLDGNLFIDRLVGAETTFITPQEYEHRDEIMARLADDLAARGHRAYVIPEGGSNALGALGYVVAMEEFSRQIKGMKLEFDHLICPVGSGGTLAGMIIGHWLYDIKTAVHGINVCDSAEYFQERIGGILREARKLFGLQMSIAKKDINVIDGYVGKGYALSRQEEIDLIKTAARVEGLILDPVYTGKAMYGLMEEIRKGRFKKGERILFWHTGGIFGLFPKKNLFF